MNISMPLLTKKPIDLLNVKCQRVMDKMKSEYSPLKDQSLIKPRYYDRISEKRFTFLYPLEQLQPLIQETKLPEIRRKRRDLFQKGYKLHVEVQEEESPILPLHKWQGPQKQSPSPPRRSTKLLPPVNLNLKQRNSQSLMVLRSHQLEEMKKLQQMISDVIQRQDYQMNHHFDNLQKELCQ